MLGRPKTRVSQIRSVPAPTGGLNDLDSFANMAPNYFVEGNNWILGTTDMAVRSGYAEWIVGLNSPAKTLISYNTPLGVSQLLACTDLGVIDVSVKGSDPDTIVHPLTEGRVDYTHFSNIATNYIVGCNGVDPAFLYDGTTYTDFTNVVTPTTPGEIKGVNPDLFVGVHSHKKRLWFIERESTTAWYLPTDSVAGEAKPFYLGSVFTKGGYLINMGTWSIDSGEGLDDLLIFMSSEGEIAGYSGSDPDNASTWSLEAVYFVAPPLSNRTMTDLGGDMILLTSSGAVPISKVIGGEMAISSYESTLSNKISKTLNMAVLDRQFDPQWEIQSIPNFQWLMISLPEKSGKSAIQYIMNTVTGAWGPCDLPIKTSVFRDDTLYFSDEQGRILTYGGALDEVLLDGSGGRDITASFVQAYNYFGEPGVNKHYKLVRPLFISRAFPSYTVSLSVDFSPIPQFYAAPQIPANQFNDLWDIAIWDEALWTPDRSAQFRWDGVQGLGFCAALVMYVTVNSEVRYVSSDWAYEPGMSI